MKTLYVAWKDAANTRRWFPVGRLDADVSAGHYRFRYLQGAAQAREQCGFAPFVGFPELHGDYASGELFPLFSNRLQNPNRPSFADYLRRLDLPHGSLDAVDPIEVLAVSEGRRVTDNLEVFPKIERGPDDTFCVKFFLHGWRHLGPNVEERIARLQTSESLGVSVETTNPETRFALQIHTRDYVLIGWAPRYLFADLMPVVLDQSRPVEATVARVNPSPAPSDQRLLVRFRGCWPASYVPMNGPEFRPLVADDELTLFTPPSAIRSSLVPC